MMQEIINTFEELKKYNYFINLGKKGYIIIKFQNFNFYHLLGLHKINLDIYFPQKCISKEKRYKYIKSHPKKFENILKNQIKENYLLRQRIETFKYIPNLLNGNNTILYNLTEKNNPMSLYNGDFGLLKAYQIKKENGHIYTMYCLLGLKTKDKINQSFNCAPQSWMADTRPNNLVLYKRPIFVIEYIKLPQTIEIKNDL